MKVFIAVLGLGSLISFFNSIFLENNFFEILGYAAIGISLFIYTLVLISAYCKVIPIKEKEKIKRHPKNHHHVVRIILVILHCP